MLGQTIEFQLNSGAFVEMPRELYMEILAGFFREAQNTPIMKAGAKETFILGYLGLNPDLTPIEKPLPVQ